MEPELNWKSILRMVSIVGFGMFTLPSLQIYLQAKFTDNVSIGRSSTLLLLSLQAFLCILIVFVLFKKVKSDPLPKIERAGFVCGLYLSKFDGANTIPTPHTIVIRKWWVAASFGSIWLFLSCAPIASYLPEKTVFLNCFIGTMYIFLIPIVFDTLRIAKWKEPILKDALDQKNEEGTAEIIEFLRNQKFDRREDRARFKGILKKRATTDLLALAAYSESDSVIYKPIEQSEIATLEEKLKYKPTGTLKGRMIFRFILLVLLFIPAITQNRPPIEFLQAGLFFVPMGELMIWLLSKLRREILVSSFRSLLISYSDQQILDLIPTLGAKGTKIARSVLEKRNKLRAKLGLFWKRK